MSPVAILIEYPSHQAYYRPETLTLVVSPTERQSAMLVQKVKWLAAKKLGVKLKKDGINKASLVFPNGSSVIGLPNSEAGIRGFSDVRLVLIDEAAGVGEDLYNAVTPMLAVSNGTLWLLSTPKGPQGFFYREWMSNEKWMRLAVPATECPRLSKEFLDEERRRKTKRQFLQEYMCDFGGDGTSLFPREITERSLRKDIKPIELNLSFLKKNRS